MTMKLRLSLSIILYGLLIVRANVMKNWNGVVPRTQKYNNIRPPQVAIQPGDSRIIPFFNPLQAWFSGGNFNVLTKSSLDSRIEDNKDEINDLQDSLRNLNNEVAALKADQPKCPDGTTEFENYCYSLEIPSDPSSQYIFYEASELCASMGGYLAEPNPDTNSIRDFRRFVYEDAFVTENIERDDLVNAEQQNCYVGIKKPESETYFQYLRSGQIIVGSSPLIQTSSNIGEDVLVLLDDSSNQFGTARSDLIPRCAICQYDLV